MELIALNKLKASRLSPKEILEGVSELKNFCRRYRYKNHSWIIKQTGLSRRRFYLFLAMSKWSKKIHKLILENASVLSITRLSQFAKVSWANARQLYNALKQDIQHLTHRKRKMLAKRAENLLNKLPYPKKDDANRPKETILSYTDSFGQTISVKTKDPKRLEQILFHYRYGLWITT